jgi:hypothetical protein
MSRKEEREDRRVEAGAAAGGRSLAEQRDQGLEAMTRSIEETKENIKRSTEEARKEMPKYSQTMTDLQSQTIDATREISESFLDSQKEVMNSIRYAWNRYPRTDLVRGWPMSPNEASEAYGSWISSVADYSVAATRMANNMMHAALETTRISTNYAKENAKELSRVTGNIARSLSKEYVDRER